MWNALALVLALALALAFGVVQGVAGHRAPGASETETETEAKSDSDHIGNWPQWRGPARNGVSHETDLPLEWSVSSNLNIKWKTPIEGRGHSSPVVWGDRIFLTTDIEGDVVPGAAAPRHVRGGETYVHPASQSADRRHTLKVIALDAASGEVAWSRTAHDGTVFDNRHRVNTYASPTAVTDGERVYVYFGSQGVFAYTFEGALAWKVDLGKILTWGHGHGMSPLLYRSSVILQVDQDEGENSFLVALDGATGKELWRTARRARINYSSPILVEANGRSHVVTTSYDAVVAYDPDTGAELWRSDGFLGNAVPTPVANGEIVFAVSGYPDKLTRAVRVPRGEEATAELLWEYRKGTGYVPSPLLYEGLLYLVSDKGVLTCLEPETGRIVYEGGRLPIPTFVKASPIAWGGHILLAGEDGDFFVLRAGPKHEILAHNDIGESVIASPAIAGGRIYIRGERHLFAVGTD
jgi:outer membrane protein assembly factor BamB